MRGENFGRKEQASVLTKMVSLPVASNVCSKLTTASCIPYSIKTNTEWCGEGGQQCPAFCKMTPF